MGQSIVANTLFVLAVCNVNVIGCKSVLFGCVGFEMPHWLWLVFLLCLVCFLVCSIFLVCWLSVVIFCFHCVSYKIKALSLFVCGSWLVVRSLLIGSFLLLVALFILCCCCCCCCCCFYNNNNNNNNNNDNDNTTTTTTTTTQHRLHSVQMVSRMDDGFLQRRKPNARRRPARNWFTVPNRRLLA